MKTVLSRLKNLRNLLPKHSETLVADVTETLAIQQRTVIQRKLDAISADYDAQKALAQLHYLQSLDFTHEKTLSNRG